MRNFNILLIHLILFITLPSFLFAANGTSLKSTRSVALGESGIALDDFWSAINNQAGLALLDKINVGLSTENRFLIKELSTYSLAFNIPTNNAGFGFNLSRFGSTFYNETSIGVGYGMKLSRNFSIGIQLDYFSIKQANGYGAKTSYYFEGGFHYKVSSDLKIAAHFFNPAISSDNIIEVAEIYQLGLSYQLQDQALLLMSIKYHSVWQLSIHTGIEFQIQSLRARLGYASKPEKLTFGLGYCYKRLSIDISNSIHSSLGNSPQISLSYGF